MTIHQVCGRCGAEIEIPADPDGASIHCPLCSTGAYFAVHQPIEGMTLEERLSRAGGMALTPTLHMAVSRIGTIWLRCSWR